MAKKLTLALAGNPNSGKTTIFNNLTGARQHVGNWPGVTVEKKEGICKYSGYEIKVVDLPGTYSLSAYSLDELIARNFILKEKPDVVLDIIDASNLERNLYLTVQFMELEIPLVLCLNMIDLAESKGYKIGIEKLSEFLSMPVVSSVGHRNQGTENLLKTVIDLSTSKTKYRSIAVGYGREIQEEINKIEELIQRDKNLYKRYPSRWLAIKLLEEDKKVMDEMENI
ncbi:MAG: FeoB small GTPase domain-containing protein [Thermodesulfobacteriota bacterium]|nr:FeoB small GTPase domain-containing protein [Thermodesulfobacteriota bacterium]